MPRDLLKRLSVDGVLAVRCRGDEWPHGFLGATPIPDAWMALVERSDGRRWLVPAGDAPRTESDDQIALIRNRTLTVSLACENSEAIAADGHAVDAKVELLLRVPPRDHEIAAFSRALIADGELRTNELAQRFGAAGGRAALLSFVRGLSPDALISQDQREALAAHFRRALRDFLFDAGLEIERVASAAFTSRTHAKEQAVRREAEARVANIQARELVEQAALAAARRQIDDLSGIFAKMRESAVHGGAWHELLDALSPTDRGRLLKNLWRLTPDRLVAKSIVAVTGNDVVWIDPATPKQPSRVVTLSDGLGALRSVQFAPIHGLFVGAARGVWRLDGDSGEVVARFAAVADASSSASASSSPTTGFNGACVFAGWLIATHSQLGAYAWKLADASAAARVLVEGAAAQSNGRDAANAPRTIRSAVVTPDGRLLIAVADVVRVFDAQLAPTSDFEPVGAAIHSIAVLDDYVYAATANGRVLRDRLDGTQGVWEVVHRQPGGIESLYVRRWNDLTELVVSAGSRGVLGVYQDQAVETPLLETPVVVRRTWVCDDAIVALSELRDRLYVLHAPTAALPIEVPLARQRSSSIQDATIVTGEVASSDLKM